MAIPAIYEAGYEKASGLDPKLAAEYIRYTVIDDPPADALIEALAPLGIPETNRLIRAGMDHDTSVLAKAPPPLREFFEEIETPPSWWDPEASRLGCKAFFEHTDRFVPAFFVATVQNAATLIARSFYVTGRVHSRFGPRRIRQNTRHLIEIMLPGGLDRHGDGWKLSVRIRLVHAQIRRLIRTEGEWDEAVYGVPLSAAQMALASASFSATMLALAQKLGARLDSAARASFMQIWRYSSWLIGTPEELLFGGDEAKTRKLLLIARACEPPPGYESATIAQALFEALPNIAGKTDPVEARALVRHAHRVTRALLGNELSDQLRIPRLHTAGLLTMMRGGRLVHRIIQRLVPGVAGAWRDVPFAFLLEAAVLDDLSDRMPDRLQVEKGTPW